MSTADDLAPAAPENLERGADRNARFLADPAWQAAVNAFREKREEAALGKRTLSVLAGRSGAYVAQVERGNLNPEPAAREALSAVLRSRGLDVSGLFDGFPSPPSQRHAAEQARVRELREAGHSDREIARRLGIPASTSHYRRRAAGCAGLPGTYTLERDGRISLTQAASLFRVTPALLRDAALDGRVRCRVERGAGLGRSGVVYLFDPDQLREDLDALPRCSVDGCTRPVLGRFGGCGGGHAGGLSWRTRKRTGEQLRRMAAGKRGKPRPDFRAIVLALHADPEQKYRWGVRLAEGRARISSPQAAARMMRRAKLRLNGLLGARERGTGAPTIGERLRRTEEGKAKLEYARCLREAHPDWGRATLARETGLAESQIRALFY